MSLNDYSKSANKQHAFLAPSRYTWIRQDKDELIQSFKNSFATQIGTTVHEYACKRILKRLKMDDNDSERNALLLYIMDHIEDIPVQVIDIDFFFGNLMNYVNDGISFRMEAESKLTYNERLCFGTCDTFSYRKGVLRIHDLKTGTTLAHMEQLEIYAALFFLQKGPALRANPSKTKVILRIYQNGEVIEHTPEPGAIEELIDIIIQQNSILQNFLEKGE